MDDHRFDDLTRIMAGGVSRRRAFKLLAGGVTGGLAAALDGRRVTRAGGTGGGGGGTCSALPCTGLFVDTCAFFGRGGCRCSGVLFGTCGRRVLDR